MGATGAKTVVHGLRPHVVELPLDRLVDGCHRRVVIHSVVSTQTVQAVRSVGTAVQHRKPSNNGSQRELFELADGPSFAAFYCRRRWNLHKTNAWPRVRAPDASRSHVRDSRSRLPRYVTGNRQATGVKLSPVISGQPGYAR
ncbi:Uncharacterized protein PBTT_03262 [Plasmodiophora brassicae]